MSRTVELGLRGLAAVLSRAPGFPEVVAALERGESAAVDGAWGSACALTAASLAAELQSAADADCPLFLIVLPRISEVDDFTLDLAGFLPRAPETPTDVPWIFPAFESLPKGDSLTDPVFGGRLRILRQIAKLGQPEAAVATEPRVSEVQAPTQPAKPTKSSKSRRTKDAAKPVEAPPAVTFENLVTTGRTTGRIVVTSIAALLQPVPSRDELARSTRMLQVGESTDPEELLRWLVERGFERVQGLELAGEFCMHGGIVDLFPPGETAPLRIEFFGDEIESIRRFDVETQRKIEDLRELSLTVLKQPPRDSDGEPRKKKDAPQPLWDTEPVFAALPKGTRIALVELNEMLDEARHFLARLDHPKVFYGVDETLARAIQFPTVTIASLAADSLETSCHLQIESIERFAVPAAQVKEELQKVVGREERVLVACHNAGERERLEEFLSDIELRQSGRLQLCEGQLLRGFRLVAERLIVLSDHELFNRRDIRRASPTAKTARIESRAIDSFLELNPGDYVVHLTKGIARYRGMELLSRKGQQEEHLGLEFREGVKVFVPTVMIHLVQKYIGGGGMAPTLSKLGSQSWERKKQLVSEAVSDLAGEMIQLQAERASKPGHAFPADTKWQQEFEAAFPYTPTVDQVAAVAAVKEDMQRARPMDRLLCGDVGYGKTEVALRGVFKAIDAGRQVAILVPTTVLAEQHYRTFCERLAEYPFNVEVLSRFRTKAEQKRTLEALALGGVDVIIGTHRLVQKDVKFKDLGLLVIDEEQRFGVEAKEKLKQLRLEVDVLTMSATPIPRTLHMSLIGIRDISNLQTPPHDRLSIETRISRFDRELIRAGIVRELNRGGQVYFVHNRVYNIEHLADTLQEIVPEARIAIVHGQMNEHEMEAAMVKFVNGEADVLVATTIIESGLDIPNANTMFIHQADIYGLADLHQLRGRVGRYKHRAYCHLLLEEGRTLTATAAKRLKAIEEFSELGAGFKIAMRDLEIRGAGNILGNEQSGHIASVGYELYCQLLEDSVRGLKNLPSRKVQHVAIDLPVSAFLPGSYVPPGRHKLDVYRKLSRVDSFEQLGELETEVRDRFGVLPPVAENLFNLKQLELLARYWKVEDIHLEDHFVVLKYDDAPKIRELARRTGILRIVDHLSAYLPLPSGLDPAAEGAGEELVALLKVMLQPAEGRSYNPALFEK